MKTTAADHLSFKDWYKTVAPQYKRVYEEDGRDISSETFGQKPKDLTTEQYEELILMVLNMAVSDYEEMIEKDLSTTDAQAAYLEALEQIDWGFMLGKLDDKAYAKERVKKFLDGVEPEGYPEYDEDEEGERYFFVTGAEPSKEQLLKIKADNQDWRVFPQGGMDDLIIVDAPGHEEDEVLKEFKDQGLNVEVEQVSIGRAAKYLG